MSDSPKPWLADDERFVARLGDLDRGLTEGPEAEANPPRAAARSVNAARPLDVSRLFETTPQPHAHRVLIDLFPPSALLPEGSTLNLSSAAPLHPPFARFPPDATPVASSAVSGTMASDTAAPVFDFVEPGAEGRGALKSLLIGVAIVLLFLAGASAALYLSREAVGRILLQWQNVPLPPGAPVRRLPMPIAPIQPPE